MAPEHEGNYHGHEGRRSLRAPLPPSPNPNSYSFGGASLPIQNIGGFNFAVYQSASHSLRPGYEYQHGTKRQNDFGNGYGQNEVEERTKPEGVTKDEDAEHGRSKRRRVRSPTPENISDYPVPDEDDMAIPPEEQTYRTKVTDKPTSTTTAEFMMEKLDFLKAVAARRERDDREQFLGLMNFNGNQRGWDGRPEAERKYFSSHFLTATIFRSASVADPWLL